MELAQEAQERRSPFFWWGICACVVLAIFLRSTPIGTRSFEVDEVYELGHLSTNIVDIAKDPDGFPPTFRWLLSLYILASGEELSRSLCALFGAATVVVCAVLGRKIGGDLVGFNAALFLSVSASQIAFGQQIRAYALYTLAIALVMLSGWMLAKQVSNRNWLFFMASSFLAMGSHYYSIYFLAIVWIFVLFNYPKENIIYYFGYAFCFVILCSPWLICLWIDLSEPLPAEWITDFNFKSFAYLYLSLNQGKCTGPSQAELLGMSLPNAMMAIAPWAISGFACSAVLIFQGIRHVGIRSLAWLILMLPLLPIVAGFVVMSIHSSFGARYLAPLSIPFAILVGCGMNWRSKSIPAIATYGLIGLNLLSVYNRSFVEKYDRENYRQLVATILERDDTPAVVVLSHYFSQAIQRELKKETPVCVLGYGTREPDDWEQNLANFLTEIGEEETIFLCVQSMYDGLFMTEKRNTLLEAVDAKRIACVSDTVNLYTLDGNKLRELLGGKKVK